MEIRYFNTINSTHKWLCDSIREGRIEPPLAVLAQEQTKGVGSRGNAWQGDKGDFFFSLAVSSTDTPSDLLQESASIYFSWLMLEILRKNGSKLWLKWPNDFYLEDKKLGGTITTKIKNIYIVSIGINLVNAHNGYSTLDIDLKPKQIAELFIRFLEKPPSWKHIFSNYRLEFFLSKKYSVHIDGREVSLNDAQLCFDGSVFLENKKVYSLR